VIEHNGTTVSFGELRERSAAIAGGLAALGVRPGDHVALMLPQSAAAAAWTLACLRAGAVVVPIAPVYAGEGLRHRLADSGAVVAAAGPVGRERLAAIDLPPGLRVMDSGADLGPQLEQPIARDPNHPAFIFYTSGSTGPAKGAVLADRVVEAVLPGFRLVFDGAPQPGDVFWTPSDWSWLGALGEVVLPALYHGHAVVACAERFSIVQTYAILRDHRVTCAFLPPVVLRRIRAEPPDEHFSLRAVMTGGEPVSVELRAAIQSMLSGSLNDDYGLTEGTHLAVGSAANYPTPPGAIGRAVHGRRIAILDRDGLECPPGDAGEIAVDATDPIVMLGYWGRPDETAAALRGGWLHTGDRGRMDADGTLWFEGRDEMTLKVSGMQIGIEEVETVISSHPDVVECGVAAGGAEAPVAAWVVLRDSIEPSERLADELRDLVRSQVAAHAYPRVVRFLAELPLTSTGKLERAALATCVNRVKQPNA